ncbi:Zn-dependent hydrolase [Algihabitans albus]|uniref:Zn-dependent hydrolase n=1 Tax=Algihabitans albus TaxID=2164067 RepID=UPI0035CE931B
MSVASRTNLSVNGSRFWETIAASAAIGTGPEGGLRRLALDDADREMRDRFIAWCEEADYSVTVDRLGNLFARRPGRDESLPPVLIGSHLDTQAAGGRFDGIVGVLGGLEVLRSLDDLGIETQRPVEVVNWTNEEGARFTPPMLSSAVFAGLRELEWALAREDDAGVTVGAELDRIGYAGPAPVGGRALDSYFEIHIEQGPRLEAEGFQVGLVTGAYVARGMILKIDGENAHSGPTAMHLRQNAIVGAAMAAVAVNDVGWRYSWCDGKSTVARLEAWPNKPGILSDEARLFIDFRSPDAETTAKMEAEIRAALPEAARRSQCRIEVAEDWTFGDLAFDPDLLTLVRETAGRLEVPLLELPSQAGHDAYNLSKLCPTVLIFTPCKGGITHNEKEDTTLEDQLPGLNVLLNAVVERAAV